MGALEELISVAKAIETKLDAAIERLANASAATPAADKPATGRGKGKATETPASTTTADQVKAEFERVKGLDGVQLPALKKVIADLGSPTLADLLTKSDKFDDAMAALKAYEATLTAGGDADDDL